jgi:hypothetical protein
LIADDNNDIVILIDCWDNGPTELRGQMYHNICTAINQIKPRLAVLATYESNEIFKWSLRDNPWISAFWNYFPDCTDSKHDGARVNDRVTDPVIMDLRLDCEQVAATRWWQFQFLLNRMRGPIPERIWFFGLHWNICLQDRELGWHNVRSHFNYNILKPEENIDIMFRDDCCLQIPFFPTVPSHRIGNQHIRFETWPDFAHDTLTRCEPVGNHAWRLI